MYQVIATYSDSCFCVRPELIESMPYKDGKYGRWERKKAMQNYAQAMNLELALFDKAGALCYLLVPCSHRPKQTIRLSVEHA